MTAGPQPSTTFGQDLRREPFATAKRRWRACCAPWAGTAVRRAPRSTAATSSTATAAGSAAMASSASGWARCMSAAARGTGSSPRTQQRQRRSLFKFYI